MDRSKLKNRYTKWPSQETFWNLRSKGISVRIFTKRRTITTFPQVLEKQFWNTLKPFLTSKQIFHIKDIAHHIGDNAVRDWNELAKELNQYYINIVQNTTGKATMKF